MTDEREMLRSSVASLVSKRSDFAAVRRAAASQEGYDTAFWNVLCEQVGAAALVVPERWDGAGGTLADAAAAFEVLGGGMVPSPLLGTTMAELALLASGNDDACARLLPGLASGAETGALVIDTAAVIDGSGASVVLGIDGDQVVEYDTTRLRSTALTPVDTTRRLASVDVSQSPATNLGPVGSALDHAAVLVAAEQVGAARRCLDITVEYTSSRVQFGRPIGSFQALKHRMADMYVAAESARAVVALAASDPTPDNVVAAATCAADALFAVAAEGVQMHGGIAITDEHEMSWLFKRAHGSALVLDTPTQRRRRLESLAGTAQ